MNYSNEDVNLARVFLKPLVLTCQLEEEALNKMITHLRYSLKKKVNDRPDILTIRETCDYLKITRPTLYKLCDDGLLQKKKVGESVRFYLKDILELLEKFH
ncbi:MAG: helix-turn-helix domain-containing protein [bacterium]|nr:helix-turn-helix domain-containing protein [bacterium]